MNDSDDMDRLWRDHHAELTGYVFKRIRHVADTEDLVSSIYLRALVATRNDHGYRTNARGWLYTIARSAITDFWRAKARAVELMDWEEQEERPANDCPHDQAIANTICGAVRAAVAGLGGTQADVMTMRLDGYEHPQIAEMMGVSVEASKMRTNRAFGTLRNRLADIAPLLEAA